MFSIVSACVALLLAMSPLSQFYTVKLAQLRGAVGHQAKLSEPRFRRVIIE